jgi:3-keto-5-aminohexanoate cleavage enzyme
VSERRPVVIEVALNGGRGVTEHSAVPLTTTDIAAEAARCFDAGATVAHIHARTIEGAASLDPAWYADAARRIRAAAPGMLISITTLRPAGFTVDTVIETLQTLSMESALPDLISVNLGHTVLWDRELRRTVHFPNDFEDVIRLLELSAQLGVVPELGVMDIGFISNAVLLRDEGLIPTNPWFLLELDSPGFGQGLQVAPSTRVNYDFLSLTLADQFPEARWAAHGFDVSTYPVLERALAHGAHVRVGLEDAIVLPDGSPGDGNVDQVRWAVTAANILGRRPATPVETRRVIGLATN